MKNQSNLEMLQTIYPQYDTNKEYYDTRINDLEIGFEAQFGKSENLRFFSAPGRIEIGGNHTDHQHGCVLAAGIDLDIVGAVSATSELLVRLYSKGYGLAEVDVSTLDVVESEKNTTAALVRGIYYKIKEMGMEVGGMDIYCTSDVLSGSGLSSSAAFEVFLGTAINHVYCGGNLTAVEIAKIGQFAENVYFGKPSGLMDQMASSVGNVVAIDFKDDKNPVIEQVDFSISEINHAICIIDSGADHADLTDEYAQITCEMGQVSAIFGKKYLREISKEDLLNSAKEVCEKAGDRAFLRALHFQNENTRAVMETEALKGKDFSRFFSLVLESGYSSFMYLQNIFQAGDVSNQKVAVALALCQEFLEGEGAFRVHGGGFAGTVQAFVPLSKLADFKSRIEDVLGEGMCHVLSIRRVGGVEIPKITLP